MPNTPRCISSTQVSAFAAALLLLHLLLVLPTRAVPIFPAETAAQGMHETTTLGSPVRIDACFVRGPKSGWLRLSFTNEADREINEIRLLVTFRGVSRQVVEAGRFTRGVAIVHEYPNEFGAPQHRSDAQCDLKTVRYIDGTTWTSASAT